MSNQTNELKNMMASFFQMNTASSSGSGSLPSNTVANPRGDLKAITTRSGVSYDGPPISPPFSSLPKVVERVPEVTKDTVQPSTINIQPPMVQIQAPIDEPVVASKLKPTIHYPSRANKQKLHEKDDNLSSKFVEIFWELHFELSFADALLHMPKFASLFKSLLNNKEKLFELAKTPVNENCSAVILKKLPKKLGDPVKFLIPCDFSKLVECLALADLGASINLMPISIWEKISLPELTPTQMILELADRSTTRPAGIAVDVFVKVGKFHFLADFVVVDYIVDPRVPLILGRPFLRTTRALIDVYSEELTLQVDDEAITFKVGKTLRYSYNDAKSVNRIDVIDVSCEEYAQEEVTLFWKKLKLVLQMIQFHRELDADFDPEGDLLPLEKLINDDPSSPFPLKELHFEEIKTIKSSIDDHPKLDLKDLPSHLEYAFLERTDKLPVIISKELKDEEKAALLKVLKSHKRAIAWKIFDIKGIDPSFCTHKILMEDDFKPAVQHQRRVNPKIHEVIKKEAVKLLDSGLIYPISDNLDHPSTFATLAMDTDIKEKVKNDLDSFVASRDYYLSVGKARKRGYVLYSPPKTGKSIQQGLEVIVGSNGDIDYLVELHDRESAEHTKGLARDNHHGYRKEGQHVCIEWFSGEFSSINDDFPFVTKAFFFLYQSVPAPVSAPAPTPASSTAEEIDLEFIAALPPDIQAEVLAQQRAQSDNV
ncbi:reverse transcriptase domain-containing protein [Tanacetum coccineum]